LRGVAVRARQLVDAKLTREIFSNFLKPLFSRLCGLVNLREVDGTGCHRRILGMQAALCGTRSAGATIMVPIDLSSPLALRPREAAKALGISTRTLWKLTAPRGPIPCVRIGPGKRQSVLYPVGELQAWLARQATAQEGGKQ